MNGAAPSLGHAGLCAAAALAAVLGSTAPLAAGPTAPATRDEAIRLLADVTLIDGACRAVTVDFGQAFRASAAAGVPPVQVMPTGVLRPAFDAATRERLAGTTREDLCGPVTRGYAEAIPGLIRRR